METVSSSAENHVTHSLEKVNNIRKYFIIICSNIYIILDFTWSQGENGLKKTRDYP